MQLETSLVSVVLTSRSAGFLFERLVVRWRRMSSIMAFAREALLMDPGRPVEMLEEIPNNQLGCI